MTHDNGTTRGAADKPSTPTKPRKPRTSYGYFGQPNPRERLTRNWTRQLQAINKSIGDYVQLLALRHGDPSGKAIERWSRDEGHEGMSARTYERIRGLGATGPNYFTSTDTANLLWVITHFGGSVAELGVYILLGANAGVPDAVARQARTQALAATYMQLSPDAQREVDTYMDFVRQREADAQRVHTAHTDNVTGDAAANATHASLAAFVAETESMRADLQQQRQARDKDQSSRSS